jgi:putative effector of murein hydrolase
MHACGHDIHMASFIGTARAFQVHETAGAFASLGMGLNAVLTAVIAPLILRLF